MFGIGHPIVGKIWKITSLPYIIASLVSAGADFRRAIFLGHERVADGGSYYVFKTGLIGMNYDLVSKDMMSSTQSRGPYFGLSKIGWKPDAEDNDGATIPDSCMPSNLLLFKSTGTKAHSTFRDILVRAIHGLHIETDGAYVMSFPDEFPTSLLEEEDKNAVNFETYLLQVVGVNILNRMFEFGPSSSWNDRVAKIVSEYQSVGPVCAVGIPGFAGKAPDVQRMMDELYEILSENSKIAKKIVKLGDQELEAGGDDMLRQVIFGSMFAGLGGTYHLTSHTISRIRSDPDRYIPMYEHDPQSFILEQARIDPPVTSYSSLTRAVTDLYIWPYGTWCSSACVRARSARTLVTSLKYHCITHVFERTFSIVSIKYYEYYSPLSSNVTNTGTLKAPVGTPQQMTIATANRDVGIFGGKSQDRSYADKFDPTRENLDRILSWNGVESEVAKHNAPRGCPGHDLSQALTKDVVSHVLPMIKRERQMRKTEL